MKNSLNLYFNENSLIHSKTRFSELTNRDVVRTEASFIIT